MTEDHQVSEETALKIRTNQYYRSIFTKYDKDRDGFISVRELNNLVESREYDHDIPAHVVQKIHDMSDTDGDHRLDFDEFVAMINNKDYSYVFGHFVNRYIHWIVPRREDRTFTVTDGQYEDEYSCYPPPVGMIVISIFEIIVFLIDELVSKEPMLMALIYDPCKRREVWRYISYMFIHIGPFHLVVNLLVQILLGLPLEMVHRWWRVLVVYLAGVLAGSLGTSLTDPTVKLAGASGGVYSLITAHIASIIMNWKEMSYPSAQLGVFVIVAGTDIGTSIYNRYSLGIDDHIGYAAHFAGGVAGLLVGINILRNINSTRTEKIVWWISMIIFCALSLTCILWNILWKEFCVYPRRSF